MVTLIDRVRNAACDGAVDEIDVGAGANGTLEIGDSGFSTVLVTFNLAATAFGAASGGTATAASLPISASAGNTGTAAEYRYKDADGTVVISGTDVGTSGNEVVISPSLSITASDNYDLTSASFTMPAS